MKNRFPNLRKKAKPINAKWIGPTIKLLKEMDFKKLKSRKLWAAVVGATLAALGEGIGLSPETVKWIVAIAGSYIVGQGIADAGAGGKSQGAE